jgi:hypothetical protein
MKTATSTSSAGDSNNVSSSPPQQSAGPTVHFEEDSVLSQRLKESKAIRERRKTEATKSLDQKDRDSQAERQIKQTERKIRLEERSSLRPAEGITAEGEEVTQSEDVHA